MAVLPSGYNVGTTGVHTGTPVQNIGAVAIGITSASAVTPGNPYIRTMPVMTILTTTQLSDRRSVPKAQSGTAHTYSAQKALTSGTFAYDPNEFLIRGYSTTINGIANNSLLINGNEQFRQRRALKLKAWGYNYATSFRAGYFSFTGVVNQRTNWTTPPSGLSATFKSTTSNVTDADDQGQYVTYRSIPGELVYLQGSTTPFQDDYKGVTG